MKDWGHDTHGAAKGDQRNSQSMLVDAVCKLLETSSNETVEAWYVFTNHYFYYYCFVPKWEVRNNKEMKKCWGGGGFFNVCYFHFCLLLFSFFL